MKRNKDKIKLSLSTGVIAGADSVVHVPKWYMDHELLVFDEEKTRVLGVFPIIQGDNYLLVEAMCRYTTIPDEVKLIQKDGESYYALLYNKGGTIIESLEVSQTPTIAIKVFDKMVLSGKYPYYYTYEDAFSILRTSKDYANVALDLPETIELLVSLSARTADGQLYRQGSKGKVNWVPLSKKHFGAPNTFTKITGSYQDEGITSALITDTEKPSRIERILRGKS